MALHTRQGAWMSGSLCIIRTSPLPHHLPCPPPPPQNYLPKFWYYEVIEKVRLVMISCVGLLILPGTSTQFVFVIAVNSVVGALQFKPFVSSDDSTAYSFMHW